jgi:aminomethyltransferase
MAIARVDVPYAVHGAKLTVAGAPAIAHSLPFDDPKKLKRAAVG